MKFQKVLNELQAEIHKGMIPSNKIFFNNNILTGEKLKAFLNTDVVNGTTWSKVLQDIMAKLKANPDILAKFKPDADPLDIDDKEVTKGKVTLHADTGEKYSYDIRTGKLFAVK